MVHLPVLDSWHKTHCNDPVMHGHPMEDHLICSTCGESVQKPKHNIFVSTPDSKNDCNNCGDGIFLRHGERCICCGRSYKNKAWL